MTKARTTELVTAEAVMRKLDVICKLERDADCITERSAVLRDELRKSMIARGIDSIESKAGNGAYLDGNRWTAKTLRVEARLIED